MTTTTELPTIENGQIPNAQRVTITVSPDSSRVLSDETSHTYIQHWVLPDGRCFALKPTEGGLVELKTPPEWAEHYGITKLIERQWAPGLKRRGYPEARRRCANVDPTKSSGYVDLADGNLWTTPLSSTEFRSLLFDDIIGTPGRRTYKLPVFDPSVRQVWDLLIETDGWISATDITTQLAEPLGYLPNVKVPPNAKVNKILDGLRAEGVVVVGVLDHDHRHPHASTRNGNSRLWTTSDHVAKWDADFELLDRIVDHRGDATALAAELLLGEPSAFRYQHHRRGVDASGDVVTIPFDHFVRLVARLDVTIVDPT